MADRRGFWIFQFFYQEAPSKHFKAFAGSQFNIPLADGGVESAYGQWWDGIPSDYSGLLDSLGISTIEDLDRCYVFRSSYVDKQLVSDWLSKNEPSNNYYLYDSKSKNFGQRIIVSPWDDIAAKLAKQEDAV